MFCCLSGACFACILYVMTIAEEIFRYLDDSGITLVFPTENAARHYLAQYVRSRRTSVLASRAIAFDEFKMNFAPKHAERPANKYHRLVFTSSFLDCGSTGLTYLYNDGFFEYRQRFVSFLARILPSLIELDQTGIGDVALFKDLVTLRRRYEEYLSQYDLFEPGWERHDISYAKGMKGRYVLVGYNSDIPMQALMRELGDVPWISTLDFKCESDVDYEQFFTEETELEALFQRLEDLKKKGIPSDDIIISTPNPDALQNRLDRKAQEYNIPLSYMKSLRLKQTVPGRYLFAIRRCINEGLSFRSMENLLLDTALPYLSIDNNRRLIRFMIEHNIQSGSLDFHKDNLVSELSYAAKQSGDDSLLTFYKDLKSALSAIRRADDGDEIVKDIHGLTFMLMGDDEFSKSDPMDKDVYSFIFSELANINRTLKENGLKMSNIFSIFMSEVEGLSYVVQEKRQGIRVFTYGQDQLLNVPYHFVFGLNDGNCTMSKSTLDFLEDHEVSSRVNFDVTDSMMEYYRCSGDHVFISGSETSYDGAQSAPTYFITRGIVRRSDFVFKEVFEKADSTSLCQVKMTQFADKGDDYSLGPAGEAIDIDSKKLSYTSISRYANCPYRAYLEMEMLTEETAPDSFEPAKQDDSDIGSFLHEVIQRFMKNHFNRILVKEKLDDYKTEISSILEQALEEDHKFDQYTKDSIRGRYLESLQNVVSILLETGGRKKGSIGPFMPLANEFRLASDPAFTGYIDSIIQSENGDIYLLDYKKGSGDATYQLVLYKRLYDLDPPHGDSVKDCYFYSMRDRAFKGFDPEKWATQETKLDEDIEKIRLGYSSGDWKATPSKDVCERCPERVVCRRRFNLQ